MARSFRLELYNARSDHRGHNHPTHSAIRFAYTRGSPFTTEMCFKNILVAEKREKALPMVELSFSFCVSYRARKPPQSQGVSTPSRCASRLQPATVTGPVAIKERTWIMDQFRGDNGVFGFLRRKEREQAIRCPFWKTKQRSRLTYALWRSRRCCYYCLASPAHPAAPCCFCRVRVL